LIAEVMTPKQNIDGTVPRRSRQRETGLTSRREVPEVPLRVPGRILPLAIRLIRRRRIDGGSGTSGMMIVNVYILDEDNETAWLRRQRPGRD